jgi:hypothetical protein
MSKGTCSICSASTDVVHAINAALEKKIPLRDLAKQSGFSRAGLSRHSRNCVGRTAISHHASMQSDLWGGRARLITVWPDENGNPQFPDDFKPEDVFLVVEYERFPDKPQNPSALLTPSQRKAAAEATEAAEVAAALNTAEIPAETAPK